MRFFMIGVAALIFSTSAPVARAQAPLEEKTEIRFELKPAVGESLLDTDGNQPVDESELALGIKFLRPLSEALEVEALPTVAYSPQVYDDNDPSSQVRVGFELRRRMSFGSDRRVLPYASAGKINAQAFVRYTPSLGFQDAFGKHSFFDNGIGAGVRFGNNVWFHCRQRWIICGWPRVRLRAEGSRADHALLAISVVRSALAAALCTAS